MLTIDIPGADFFDEENSMFTRVEPIKIEFEHSLVSLSKWEAEVGKPFLAPGEKTKEEILLYIQCMIVTPVIPENIMTRFTDKHYFLINTYIDSPQSATTFYDLTAQKNTKRKEIITTELIYYWMILASIPFECETWHLNRLFSLIRIHNIKNSKDKRLDKSDKAAMIQQRNALNEQRRAQMNSNG